MRHLLLLLFMTTLAAAGCSEKEDNSVKYSDTVGYMSNLESVKYGIVGRWSLTTNTNVEINFAEDGKRCSGYKTDEVLTSCCNGEYLQIDGKYTYRGYTETYPNGVDTEIVSITKTTYIEKNDRGTFTYTRVSAPRD